MFIQRHLDLYTRTFCNIYLLFVNKIVSGTMTIWPIVHFSGMTKYLITNKKNVTSKMHDPQCSSIKMVDYCFVFYWKLRLK